MSSPPSSASVCVPCPPPKLFFRILCKRPVSTTRAGLTDTRGEELLRKSHENSLDATTLSLMWLLIFSYCPATSPPALSPPCMMRWNTAYPESDGGSVSGEEKSDAESPESSEDEAQGISFIECAAPTSSCHQLCCPQLLCLTALVSHQLLRRSPISSAAIAASFRRNTAPAAVFSALMAPLLLLSVVIPLCRSSCRGHQFAACCLSSAVW